MFQNVVKFTYKTSLMTCSCLCAASFAARASEMQCFNVNCESLGYTNVEDLGDTPCKSFLTCPYDPRYIKCDLLPTCENLGFTNDDKSAWCTNLVRCPTDPSYTLCKSLCSKCPEGTALDPAELGCTDGYEAALDQDGIAITNDCSYTCYRCSDGGTDTSYWCEDPEDAEHKECVEEKGYSDDSCSCESNRHTESECPEGTYIVEVRYPTTVRNAKGGEHYICAPCPKGLTNSGKNNYDCMTTDENGDPVPNCDTNKGYYNKCQTGWEVCREVHTEFGTCYMNADKCGEGTLTEANGVYMTRPSTTGHRITEINDSFENTCYQLTCAYDTETGCRKAFSEYGTYGAKCIEDKYTCFVFHDCNEGYEWSPSSSACVCNTLTHPYDVYNIPDYSTPIEDEKCWDGSEYIYKDFKCDGSHVKKNGKCLCPDIYSISEHDIPSHAIGVDPCTDSDDDTFFKSWECVDGYTPDGNDGCMKKTCHSINENYFPLPDISGLTFNQQSMAQSIIKSFYQLAGAVGSDGACYRQKPCQQINAAYFEGAGMASDSDCNSNDYTCRLPPSIPNAGAEALMRSLGLPSLSCYSKSCNTSVYKYAIKPENGYLVEPKCTDSQGTHYSDRACNAAVSGYQSLTLEGNVCLLPVLECVYGRMMVLHNRNLTEKYGIPYTNITSISYYDENKTLLAQYTTITGANDASGYAYENSDGSHLSGKYYVVIHTGGKDYRTNMASCSQ